MRPYVLIFSALLLTGCASRSAQQALIRAVELHNEAVVRLESQNRRRRDIMDGTAQAKDRKCCSFIFTTYITLMGNRYLRNFTVRLPCEHIPAVVQQALIGQCCDSEEGPLEITAVRRLC